MKAIGLVAAHRGVPGGSSYAADHRSRSLVESMPTGLSMDNGLWQDAGSFGAAAGWSVSAPLQEQWTMPPLPPDELPLPGSRTALDIALGLLQEFAGTAVEDVALFGSRQAADFAGQVEELSRIVDCLQLLAAGLVERVRRQDAVQGGSGSSGDGAMRCPADGAVREPGPGSPEFRNAAEFLRARLRIGLGEARRRLALADALLPRTGLTGQVMAPEHEHLAVAVSAGTVSCRSASIIAAALDRIRPLCPAQTTSRIEAELTATAQENDADFLHRVARRWTETIDHDGAEPREELLRQLQGAFLRKPRHGLQHLEIFATAEQFEHLVTVMNTAANPRMSGGVDSTGPAGEVESGGTDESPGAASQLDRRSRPQKMLDGLVGACKVALSTGTLPAAGGLRPQIMVTISHQDLLAELKTPAELKNPPSGSTLTGTGTKDAPFLAAPSRRLGAKPTTSTIGPGEDAPAQATARFCAAITTTSSTKKTGVSASGTECRGLCLRPIWTRNGNRAETTTSDAEDEQQTLSGAER
ncbi:13E12 repeat family protein [Arthrobacter sp. CJ23]|nr:13E12 repeat family protein [Arthrobacter sp. CJ23]UVJ40465.1 13E12 repeat family protein [Arthrobacter sp. CJ23]